MSGTGRRGPLFSATMIEKVLAAVVLVVCLVFMVRLLVGVRRRMKFDAWARGLWNRVRDLYRWRASRKTAERVAEEAIRRARENGTWEGNVYKPKSFKRPPRDKLH
jgi:uncharacterized membrane protein